VADSVITRLVYPPLLGHLRKRHLLSGVTALQELVRVRGAQERELCGRGRLGELRAPGPGAVSTGDAKLRAASDVSSQKSGDSRVFCFVLLFKNMRLLKE